MHPKCYICESQSAWWGAFGMPSEGTPPSALQLTIPISKSVLNYTSHEHGIGREVRIKQAAETHKPDV